MRIIALVICLAFISLQPAFSQELHPCGTTEKMQEAIAADPSILINQEQVNAYVKEWIENHRADVRDENLYIIPLVVHVVHDYGVENISDDQVRDAVRILNEDFRKRNADTSAIVDAFKNIAADTKIEFRLANKAPDGSCTNGIDRIHSLRTYYGDDNAKFNPWPRNEYFNVWTVRNLEDGIAGYAYFPSSVNGNSNADIDGVIILSSYMGSTGTGSTTTSRALTHELGHSMGLAHVWGFNNSPGIECGDDGIDDTPDTEGWTSCKLDGSKCNAGVIENVQNYMEYSYCSKMFTGDQGLSMQAVLNSGTAQRNNLWTEGNLLLTGTDKPTQNICAPKADFYSAAKMGCVGNPVTFNDASWNGETSSRTWTFQDGTTATPNEANPEAVFSTPGWKSVTLNVSNAAGSNEITKTNYIYISDTVAARTVGWWDGFENAEAFTEWLSFNRASNSSAFTRTTTAGYYSASSVKLSNYNNQPGDIDQLVSPSYDLSVGGEVYLNFRYSCASGTPSESLTNDIVSIFTSTDCGESWLIRTSIMKSTLANNGFVSGAYTPGGNSIWTARSILLPEFLYQPNVRFKFEYKTNGEGNNFYLDDVHVSHFPVGINDPEAAAFELEIFPNPANETSVVVLQQQSAKNVLINVLDLQGRTMAVIYDGVLSEGQHQFNLFAGGSLEPGLYVLAVNDGSTVRRVKFLVP
jgi:PKD repeat protein